MNAVSVRDLGWKYAGRKNFAIQDINLDIEENTFVSIVGPNEHGKTTLVSCIKSLIPNNFYGVWKGEVEIFGQDSRSFSSQQMAKEVGFVFADPESQFTCMTVEEELAFGLENIGLAVSEISERIKWASDIALIGDLLDKPPYEISGGQKQRVAIASVIAMRPRIIILDEPTSMIDPLGKELILEIMVNIKEQTDLTVIVVEHNLEQVAPISDVMLLMYKGNIKKKGPPSEFFEDSAFLQDCGICPPQVTVFISRLKQEKLYSGPLPLELTKAIKITEEVLSTRMIRKDNV